MSKENKQGTNTKSKEAQFAFAKENYQLLIVGVVILIVGYMLMMGGGDGDPTKFNAKEIFSWRRITLAPYVVIFGYAFIIYAIMKRPKKEV